MRYCQEKGIVCQYAGTNMHCRLTACVFPKESLYPTASGGGHLMDIEKLIEQLNDFNENHIAVLCGSGQCACGYLCDKDDCIVVRAATALSTLQAENEKLKDQLYDGEGVNLVNYWMQQAKIEENGHRNCQAENEQLRAELEQVKAERDAVVEKIREWEKFDTYLFVHNFITPEKWRGPKED